MVIKESIKTPVYEQCDVLVCGGRSDGGFFGPACGYATGCPANKRCYDS